MIVDRNRLRTSCSTAVGRRDFNKQRTEDGAVPPIKAVIWFCYASPEFLLHCVPQKLHIAAERYRQFRLYFSINYFFIKYFFNIPSSIDYTDYLNFV